MIIKNVSVSHILSALAEIDVEGVPARRQFTDYHLLYQGKRYPPKYVLSVATKYATGSELAANDFGGGKETNTFLQSRGFEIWKGNRRLRNKTPSFQILRLILKRKYNLFNADHQLAKAFTYVGDELVRRDRRFDFLLTPGGFLEFEWPDHLPEDKTAQVRLLRHLAALCWSRFWQRLPTRTRQSLANHVRLISTGIDSEMQNEHGRVKRCIQFVILFDPRKEKIVHWTGKSYSSVADVTRGLIEIDDLSSHFWREKEQSICLLGCHDLKLFSPRAKAIAGESRQRKMSTFDRLMRKYRPTLVLQHPHNTDTPNIWNQDWRQIQKLYPFVTTYASGIRYHNYGNRKRAPLNKVLEKTQFGNITDITY
jgi:hypothetical protein